MSVIVTVPTELTQSQALAQFAKRLTWSEIQACAVDEDKTYEMRDTVQRGLTLSGTKTHVKQCFHLLQKSLAEASFSPR